MKISLQDIFSIPTAVIYYPDLYKSVTSVSIDTRSIKKNSIYVAIKGSNFDGHDFVDEAVKKGAKAIVVRSRKLNRFDHLELPIISVRNTLDAYAELAKIWRNKNKAKVISITGSNGKTSTKEILTHLLSKKYRVHKTHANNNNKIGVPLTMLSALASTDYVVLEHGTNHFGEIEYTAKIAQPDYAMITNIGNSHIQYLGSKEKILSEKSKLFNEVNNNGIVFINNDDALIKRIKKQYANTVTFGFKGRCDVKGKIIGFTEDSRAILQITHNNKAFDLTLPILGDAGSKNYLAAISIALKIGLSKKDLISATKSLEFIKGRLQVKEFNEFTIIDDTYNSNPESVRNALTAMKRFKKRKKKIVVFGDMLELGKQSIELHKSLSTDFRKAKIDSVFTIGRQSKNLIDHLTGIKNKLHFSSRKSLNKYLLKMDLSDSVVLVKGSRGMKMDEFVETIENRVK